MRAAGTLGHADINWRLGFYVTFMFTAVVRVLLLGFSARQAMQERANLMARAIYGNHTQSALSSPMSQIGSSSSSSFNNSSSNPSSSRSSRSQPIDLTICLACGEVNTHKSPACPLVTASGPTIIPDTTRASVRALIASAPITAPRRAELSRIASKFYSKIDRENNSSSSSSSKSSSSSSSSNASSSSQS